MKDVLKLLRYLKPHTRSVLLFTFLSLLAIVFSLFSITMVIPFLGILFDNQPLVLEPVSFELSTGAITHNFYYYLSKIILEKGKMDALVMVTVLIAVLSFFKTFLNYTANLSLAGTRFKLVRDIRNSIADKILYLPVSYFTEERKGDVMTRVSNDVTEIEASVINSIVQIFKEPFTIGIYLTTLVLISPSLTIFAFILLPLAGLIISLLGKSLRKRSFRAQSKLGDLLSVVEEILSGQRVIKAFNAQEKLNIHFRKINDSYTRLIVRMWYRKAMAVPMGEFLGTVTVLTVMWFGATEVLKGENGMTPQSFIGYLVVFSQMISPMKAIAATYFDVRKGLASVDRVNGILNQKSTILDSDSPITIERLTQSIQFKDVFFKYQDDYVLKDINLEIKRGETVALVGASGGGKSTIADLLPRFYDVSEGTITIDGRNIRDFSIYSLRSLYGIVGQESMLFNDTIANNIAFGVEHATETEIIEAAKIANAHDFILEAPQGYQTMIGDRGAKLSGGQRQRISIARAVLKNPEILILDEATSALDTESEKLVQDAINKLLKNRTALVIAHRLSTIVNADRIVVLDNGEIKESGTHIELLEKDKGMYRKLYELQTF